MFSKIILNLLVIVQGNIDRSPSIADCHLPADSKVTLDSESLPASIQADLKNLIPDMAPRNAKFQRHDMIREPNLPVRRFVGAVQNKKTWVVVYEHGIENHIHAIRFSSMNGRNEKRFFLFPNGNLIGEMCPTITASLSGVFSSEKGHL